MRGTRARGTRARGLGISVLAGFGFLWLLNGALSAEMADWPILLLAVVVGALSLLVLMALFLA